MPTLEQLLLSKARRLESVPDRFASKMQAVQIELLREIQDILASFDVDSSGNFVISEKNMALAAQMDVKLREALDRSEYAEAITEFAKEFNVQIDVSDAYFNTAFPAFKPSDIGKMAVRSAQKTAVDLLINTSPDADFIRPIQSQIEAAVVNGARFRETLDIIQLITTGDDETDGKILQYSKQIAHDTFAVADRSYASAVAEELGAEWGFYSGNHLRSSRPFCDERKGKFFCKEEVRRWGDGINTDPSQFEWPKSGTWVGEMQGTNGSTIFSTLGGYNCVDSYVPVSIFAVPIKDVKRAIDLGFYTPTDFEKEELGL